MCKESPHYTELTEASKDWGWPLGTECTLQPEENAGFPRQISAKKRFCPAT